jgi:hypothetical protein
MNTAFVRVYEELNDFLPLAQRKKRFQHPFKNNPSIKDLIESVGIPHTEVDLILINGQSVDFSAKVQDGDYISIYPVFESFDVKKVSKVRPMPLRKVKFVVDTHLGKLARYLRMLGFDALYKQVCSPKEIIQLALQEHRIILSNSRALLKNKSITHGFCINSYEPLDQLKKVLRRFCLWDEILPFSRCMVCNAELHNITKDEIQHRLPPKVKNGQQEFKICPACKRIYWKGTHYERMMRMIKELDVPRSQRHTGRNGD